MAGTIAADTLTHSTAGSLTTDFVVNGSAKAWLRFNSSTGTPTLNDSLNISSITDNAVGHYEFNFSSSMTNVNYTFSASAHAQADHIFDGGMLNITTGFAELYYGTGGTPGVYANSRRDAERYGGIVMGDLA